MSQSTRPPSQNEIAALKDLILDTIFNSNDNQKVEWDNKHIVDLLNQIGCDNRFADDIRGNWGDKVHKLKPKVRAIAHDVSNEVAAKIFAYWIRKQLMVSDTVPIDDLWNIIWEYLKVPPLPPRPKYSAHSPPQYDVPLKLVMDGDTGLFLHFSIRLNRRIYTKN